MKKVYLDRIERRGCGRIWESKKDVDEGYKERRGWC